MKPKFSNLKSTSKESLQNILTKNSDTIFFNTPSQPPTSNPRPPLEQGQKIPNCRNPVKFATKTSKTISLAIFFQKCHCNCCSNQITTIVTIGIHYESLTDLTIKMTMVYCYL